ncbi:ribosome biogenesis GTP-binding protein YsxC [Candidatus Gracilibacteria bacterium]|nr:MAG: ribosome biogenesis GTP-binding protein YsxC [Candidatus Gracilibacteria bacterium]
MKIKEVRFLKSVHINSKEDYYDNIPEVIFVGRSNVGKSSIMNKLFEKKDLVKTSSRAGKTKTANIFFVNNKYYFTDLPGYGFSKLGKELKDNLDALIYWYIEERINTIKTVVILIDSKLGAQEKDIQMYKRILDLGLDIVILLSKADKLSKSEISKSKSHTENIFFGQEVIPVSSTKNIGIKDFWKILDLRLKKIIIINT